MRPLGGYRSRLIAVDATATRKVEESGSYVEVIDGGIYGRLNKLYFGRAEYGDQDAFSGENFLPCEPGASAIAEFDYLLLVSPDASVIRDSVRLRIGGGNVEKATTGKSRIKWLTRSNGSQTIAASATVVLLDLSSPVIDRYFSDREDFDARCYWCGWITGKKSWQASVTAKTDPTNGAAGERLVQMFNPTDNHLTTPPLLSGFNFDFSTPLRFPLNAFKVTLLNSDATGGFFDWALGYTGLR